MTSVVYATTFHLRVGVACDTVRSIRGKRRTPERIPPRPTQGRAHIRVNSKHIVTPSICVGPTGL